MFPLFDFQWLRKSLFSRALMAYWGIPVRPCQPDAFDDGWRLPADFLLEWFGGQQCIGAETPVPPPGKARSYEESPAWGHD